MDFNSSENMIYLFHAESVDLLDGMEESLLFIQDNGADKEHIKLPVKRYRTRKITPYLSHTF